jgi:hypothetical protein
MQTTKQVMEQGLADGIYIDYWQEEDKFQCIRTAIIKEICDQVCVLMFVHDMNFIVFVVIKNNLCHLWQKTTIMN